MKANLIRTPQGADCIARAAYRLMFDVRESDHVETFDGEEWQAADWCETHGDALFTWAEEVYGAESRAIARRCDAAIVAARSIPMEMRP